MKTTHLLLAALLLASVFSCLAIMEETDAEITPEPIGNLVKISGSTVLTDDYTFADNSKILIERGADINISKYTMDFGSNSTITVAGEITIECTTGELILGEGTKVQLIGAAIPDIRKETTVEFNGTLTLSGIGLNKSGAMISFQPNGGADSIRFTTEDQKIAVKDPHLKYELEKGTLRYMMGFSALTRTSWNTDDDGKLLSTRTTVFHAQKDSDSVIMSISLDGITLERLDIEKIVSTTTYKESDIVDRITITDIGPTTFSTDSNGYQIINTAAASVVTEANDGDKPLRKTEMDDVRIRTVLDPQVPSILLLGTDTGEKKQNWLKSFNMTASSFKIDDYEDDRSFQYHDIVLTINGAEDADPFLVLSYYEEDVAKVLTMTGVKIASFGITTGFVIDLDMTIDKVTFITSSPSGEDDTDVLITDMVVKAKNLDLSQLYNIYSRTGTIQLQEILNNSDGFELDAAHVTMNRDTEDGPVELQGENVKILAEEDTRGYNTLSLDFDSLAGRAPWRNHDMRFTVDRSEIYVESSGKVSDCLDAFFKKIDFSSDSYAQVKISSAGFKLGYNEETDRAELTLSRVSESAPTFATVIIAIDHSTYGDITNFGGTVNATGYNLTYTRHTDYQEPPGEKNLELVIKDLSGSYSLSYGDTIGFGINVGADISMDLEYYGINVQAEAPKSALSTTHGTLWVDGYNPKEEGIFAMFEDMRDEDFIIDTRFFFESESVTIYKNNRSELYLEYTSVEIDAKRGVLDLKHDENLLIHLTKAHLAYIEEDGTLYERNIPVLDFNKDLAGKDPSPTLFDIFAERIIITCAIVSLFFIGAIIYYRVKHPHLFKFIEGEHEED